MTLNGLAETIAEINEANGWDRLSKQDFDRALDGVAEPAYRLCTFLALVTTETSEAVEAVRRRDPENFAEELADILIRVLDIAAMGEVDIAAEVRVKLERNRNRGRRHGGKAL